MCEKAVYYLSEPYFLKKYILLGNVRKNDKKERDRPSPCLGRWQMLAHVGAHQMLSAPQRGKTNNCKKKSQPDKE